MRLLLLSLVLGTFIPAAAAGETLLLSDLSSSRLSETGWEWQGFADTVMGGNSSLNSPRIIVTPEGRALNLSGEVVTKGGGFIQVRLKHEDGPFDASAYSGVEIELQAPQPEGYYVFVRTRDNVFPWSYYGFKLHVRENRTTIRIPWEAFKAEAMLRRQLRPELLTSVAVVAAYQDFNADLNIYKVSLYR